jgi:hypothetical protein
MPANTMTVANFVEAALLLPPSQSVLVRGDHGIGKSQVVRQIAKKIAVANGKKLVRFDAKHLVQHVRKHGEEQLREMLESLDAMVFIDCRLGQMTEGDVIGMPSTENGITWFNPPIWFRIAMEIGCIVFLDEINRGTNEVMQAAFQIVLDHEMGGNILHPDTRVFSALNDGSSYTVNEMDPALLDRFWTIDLRPTATDWDRWAGDPNEEKRCGFNVLPLVRQFIKANSKWLDPKVVDPGDVTTSRRSWEKLSDALEHAKLEEASDKNVFFNVVKGFIGNEGTTDFVAFAKTFDTQVTGEQLLLGYNNDPSIRRKIAGMGIENINTMIDRVCDFIVRGDLERLTPKMGGNLQAFVKDLPSNELRVNCWTQLTRVGVERVTLVKSVHKYIRDLVVNSFGVNEDEILDRGKPLDEGKRRLGPLSDSGSTGL